ncbi:hypothetical protein AMS68_000092 [Peltaster fructicola]|uniref:LysM domain-containing protein n=1 Tax=Peltaster fructicola TaxID=286661 RepID=A0A6H0XIX4_9PEZI|nr:hypothetical protein AMS68_000092 [Peltaster fructicola]
MARITLLGLLAVSPLATSVFAQNDSFFFNGTDLQGRILSAVSSGCIQAMEAPLDCDQYLTYVMTSDYWGSIGNETFQKSFCRDSCGTGLSKYVSSVQSACANDPQPFPGYPAAYWGESAQAAWTQMCLKDSSTGQYCSEFIEGIFAQAANASTNDSDFPTDLPDNQLCSNCVQQLFQHIQSTPYSNYDARLASEWSSIQSKCGTSYPTAVPALRTNVTQPGGFAAPGSARTGCLSGNHYTVASGDNCVAISSKQKVSTGTLKAINDLYPDCSNLWAGANLCVPPTCTTYTIQSGDTCFSISNATSINFSQLTSWNPAIDSSCDNLIAGENLCISPPGGVPSLTTIAGATVTQTAIYASTTAARPSPVGDGTTTRCGDYYKVNYGDTCQNIALNQTVALNIFYGMNPSIDSKCSNLQLGVYYCVEPTQDWNTTASSTIATAPTTTPSGTTADCYEYYTIQSGDYCGKVESMFGITMVQLSYWNPSLNADCGNLALGEAYCVNGENQPPQGTQAAQTSAAAKRAVVEKHRREAYQAELPVRTPAPEGGVPMGWPGLMAPRLQKGAGYDRVEL